MFLCGNCSARLVDRSTPCIGSVRALGKRHLASSVVGALRSNDVRSESIQSRMQLRQKIPPWNKPSQPSRLHGPKHRYSTSTSSSAPFRLAIIGSGPAGFYTASRVLKHHHDTKIDMYERFPVPFGLVRYGVAPDHPEVKNCQDRFEEIAESPGFEFVGNVAVGGQIPLSVMRRHYDAILFTYGASDDRTFGVEGENLKGVWSARSFVAWYNGLPGYSDLDFGLENADNTVIIGQGNVSLDVARVLLTDVDNLRKSDIPGHVLEALSKSKVKHVMAVGRRGPLQAAFTIKEIRELTVLPDVSFGAIDRSLFPSDLKSLPRSRRRIAELLLKASSTSSSSKPQPHKSFNLAFFWSPIQFQDGPETRGNLGSVLFQHQSFADGADPFDPSASVKPVLDDTKSIETLLAFRSIGYKSTPLAGLSDLGIQFNSRKGVIPNEGGRIVRLPAGQPGMDVPQSLPGLYVAGWVKRGPTGVIASTMEDAFATADCIIQDINAGRSFLNGHLANKEMLDGWEGVQNELQNQGIDARRTSWKDWRRIDEVERERGAKQGKEREKITSIGEMLKVLDG